MSGVYGYPNDPTLSTGTVGTGGGAGGTNVGETETSVAALNNGIRGLAGDVAMHRNDTGGKLTTGGAANAYTVALESLPTSLADGMMFSAIVHATNTGASTITPNSGVLAAKAILYKAAALSGGELVVGQVYRFSYDSSAASGSGAWLLENPSPVASALPSYTSNDIGDDSNYGAASVTEALNTIKTNADAITSGVSTAFDTLAEVETKFGQVDASIATAEGELDAVLPDGATGTFTRPRMTTTARDALDMTGKAAGYEIYNTTTGQVEEWDGVGAWGASGGSGPGDLTETVLLDNVRVSGPDYTITGIPDDAVYVEVVLEDFSSSLGGNQLTYFQMGDAGGIESTEYMVTGDGRLNSGASVYESVHRNGLTLVNLFMTTSASESFDARILLKKIGTGLWEFQYGAGQPGSSQRSYRGFGYKQLSGELTQIFLNTGSNFDGNSDVTVRYWS